MALSLFTVFKTITEPSIAYGYKVPSTRAQFSLSYSNHRSLPSISICTHTHLELTPRYLPDQQSSQPIPSVITMCKYAQIMYRCCGRYSSFYVTKPCANFKPNTGCNNNPNRRDVYQPKEVLCPYCYSKKLKEAEEEKEAADTVAGATDEERIDPMDFESKQVGWREAAEENDRPKDGRDQRKREGGDAKVGAKRAHWLKRASQRVGRLVRRGGEQAKEKERQ